MGIKVKRIFFTRRIHKRRGEKGQGRVFLSLFSSLNISVGEKCKTCVPILSFLLGGRNLKIWAKDAEIWDDVRKLNVDIAEFPFSLGKFKQDIGV